MKPSPLFSSSNGLTVVFLLLYGAGVVSNIRTGNSMMAVIWLLLFALNLARLLQRLVKQYHEEK